MKSLIQIITLSAIASCFVNAEQELKMRSLFNGKDLSGWKGDGYVVEDGAISCTPKGKNLITEETFSNYVLEFDFLLTPGANNGLGIHYPGTGDGAYTGMEIQVLDNTAEKYKNLKEYQFHGSIYTLAPAKKSGLKPVGEWNHQRVTVNGSKVQVILNGETILDVDLEELSKKDPKHEGAKRRSGHIGWLGHGDKVSYKNIQIADLAPTVDEAALKKEGFTQIFDGASLKGWKHEPETKNWSAINGVLKHDGTPTPTKDLWSEKSYKDITIQLDWRWAGRGPMKMQPVVKPDGSNGEKVEVEELDSGLYLRGDSKSQVNFWNWTVGSGEVYGFRMDNKQPAEVRAAVTPKAKADKPLGEWNRTIITLKGDRLTVTLNGQVVIENAQLPGTPKEGPIGFQHHGSKIDFANVWIKEL
ncbi:MAG: DUF1080 domain-containing protein [Akkermansiaceae bacterium]|jgi:hypothetical protein|nr:DUF1080 domain-containing protein [Luteolibacter sp.]